MQVIYFGPFYRAMLNIARTMLSQDVCLSVGLSVYLSVTRWYFVETAEDFIILFHRRVATPRYDYTLTILCLIF